LRTFIFYDEADLFHIEHRHIHSVINYLMISVTYGTLKSSLSVIVSCYNHF